jgi:sugar phosphate isomerase/epimerase
LKSIKHASELCWKEEEIVERIGVNTDIFTPDEPICSADFEMIHRAGLHLVELSGFHSSRYSHHNQEQQDDISSACRKYNIRVVSFHSPILPYASEDEEERREAVEEGSAAIKAAYKLGAEIGVGHFGISSQSKKSILEILRRLEGLPIRLAVENEEKVDLTDVMGFIDDIASPRVGMAVDIGHPRDPDGINPFLKADKAFETLKQCGSRVIHVHLHETHIIDHVPPFIGAGNIRWGEVFSALKVIDYPGYFIFEYGNKRENAFIPGSEEEKLQAIISDTPADIVQSVLHGTPEQLAVGRKETDSTSASERQLREYLKTILRKDHKILGKHPAGVIRSVLGATTEELLKATVQFPREFIRRYCR